MQGARILWEVDSSEIDKFRNILINIKTILNALDKSIVDSIDISVLENVKEQFLKRMTVKSVKDKKDG